MCDSNWNPKMRGDLGRAFNDLMNFSFITFRGVQIERKGGGFMFRGKWYQTLGEIGDEIDRILNETDNELPR